jgi:hypothetical protein
MYAQPHCAAVTGLLDHIGEPRPALELQHQLLLDVKAVEPIVSMSILDQPAVAVMMARNPAIVLLDHPATVGALRSRRMRPVVDALRAHPGNDGQPTLRAEARLVAAWQYPAAIVCCREQHRRT